ncbi:unnamed protein product [Arabidopsis halleri]
MTWHVMIGVATRFGYGKKKNSLPLFDPAFGPSASPHADDFELSHAGDYELVP